MEMDRSLVYDLMPECETGNILRYSLSGSLWDRCSSLSWAWWVVTRNWLPDWDCQHVGLLSACSRVSETDSHESSLSRPSLSWPTESETRSQLVRASSLSSLSHDRLRLDLSLSASLWDRQARSQDFEEEGPGSGTQHQKGFLWRRHWKNLKNIYTIGALYCNSCIEIINFDNFKVLIFSLFLFEKNIFATTDKHTGNFNLKLFIF